MTTNSKPELCEVCGGTRERPLWRCTGPGDSLIHIGWHHCCSPDEIPACRRCTAPNHSQADKYKRVAERLLEEFRYKCATVTAYERILREEYPE